MTLLLCTIYDGQFYSGGDQFEKVSGRKTMTKYLLFVKIKIWSFYVIAIEKWIIIIVTVSSGH